MWKQPLLSPEWGGRQAVTRWERGIETEQPGSARIRSWDFLLAQERRWRKEIPSVAERLLCVAYLLPIGKYPDLKGYRQQSGNPLSLQSRSFSLPPSSERLAVTLGASVPLVVGAAWPSVMVEPMPTWGHTVSSVASAQAPSGPPAALERVLC